MSLLLPHHPITANGDLPSRELVELFQRLERSIPALSGLTVANFDAAAINTSGEGLSDSDTELPTTASVTDAIAAAAFGGFTDVTGSRAHSTSYQNTSGKTRLVQTVTSGAGSVSIETSPDNSTWTVVARATSGGYLWGNMFHVPDTYYWRINGSVTVSKVYEADL